jgi:hypothetical protein
VLITLSREFEVAILDSVCFYVVGNKVVHCMIFFKPVFIKHNDYGVQVATGITFILLLQCRTC